MKKKFVLILIAVFLLILTYSLLCIFLPKPDIATAISFMDSIDSLDVSMKMVVNNHDIVSIPNPTSSNPIYELFKEKDKQHFKGCIKMRSLTSSPRYYINWEGEDNQIEMCYQDHTLFQITNGNMQVEELASSNILFQEQFDFGAIVNDYSLIPGIIHYKYTFNWDDTTKMLSFMKINGVNFDKSEILITINNITKRLISIKFLLHKNGSNIHPASPEISIKITMNCQYHKKDDIVFPEPVQEYLQHKQQCIEYLNYYDALPYAHTRLTFNWHNTLHTVDKQQKANGETHLSHAYSESYQEIYVKDDYHFYFADGLLKEVKVANPLHTLFSAKLEKNIQLDSFDYTQESETTLYTARFINSSDYLGKTYRITLDNKVYFYDGPCTVTITADNNTGIVQSIDYVFSFDSSIHHTLVSAEDPIIDYSAVPILNCPDMHAGYAALSQVIDALSLTDSFRTQLLLQTDTEEPYLSEGSFYRSGYEEYAHVYGQYHNYYQCYISASSVYKFTNNIYKTDSIYKGFDDQDFDIDYLRVFLPRNANQCVLTFDAEGNSQIVLSEWKEGIAFPLCRLGIQGGDFSLLQATITMQDNSYLPEKVEIDFNLDGISHRLTVRYYDINEQFTITLPKHIELHVFKINNSHDMLSYQYPTLNSKAYVSTNDMFVFCNETAIYFLNASNLSVIHQIDVPYTFVNFYNEKLAYFKQNQLNIIALYDIYHATIYDDFSGIFYGFNDKYAVWCRYFLIDFDPEEHTLICTIYQLNLATNVRNAIQSYNCLYVPYCCFNPDDSILYLLSNQTLQYYDLTQNEFTVTKTGIVGNKLYYNGEHLKVQSNDGEQGILLFDPITGEPV